MLVVEDVLHGELFALLAEGEEVLTGRLTLPFSQLPLPLHFLVEQWGPLHLLIRPIQLPHLLLPLLLLRLQ